MYINVNECNEWARQDEPCHLSVTWNRTFIKLVKPSREATEKKLSCSVTGVMVHTSPYVTKSKVLRAKVDHLTEFWCLRAIYASDYCTTHSRD